MRTIQNSKHRIQNSKLRAAIVLMVLLLVGAGFSIFNMPLASSAANLVQVAHSEEAVPTDPQSPAWERVQEAVIPLSAQQIYQPGGGTTRTVSVRAVEDGQNIAIRMSWNDDTLNDTVGELPSDAAAIQLPMDPEHLPYQCMGQTSNRVNIWQWKAVLEREGTTTLDSEAMTSTGVRNLTANGICKAVDTPGIDPQARSYFDGKQWHLVFYRALSAGNRGTAPLHVGENTSVAFAVWNGANREARGMKAVSTWNAMQFRTSEESGAGSLITLGVIVAISAGVIAYTMRRLAS